MKATTALAAAAVLHAARAQQFTPNLIFNVTVNTMCGLFEWSLFESFALRDAAAGIIPWESWYDGMNIPYSAFVAGMIGAGNATHFVSSQYFSPSLLPSFAFTFPGMGWALTGFWRPWNATVSEGDIEIRADGSYSELLNPVDTLGGQKELAWGMHTVNYTLRSDYDGGGNWSVNDLTMMTGMVSNAPSISEVPKTVVNFVQNGKPNPSFAYTGAANSWQVQTQLGGWGGQAPIAYTQLVGNFSTSENLAMVQVPIPANTSFVVVNGTMGPSYGQFGVVWEPVPAIGKSPASYWPYTHWDVPNALLYFQPLNPTVQYNMTIGVVATEHQGVGLTSITFYSGLYNGTGVTPGSGNAGAAKKSSNGAIIGGAVGGAVGGIALIGILVFYFLRKRKSAKVQEHEKDLSRFEVDETAALTTPFVPPAIVQTYNVQAPSTTGFITGGFATAGYTGQDLATPSTENGTPGLFSTTDLFASGAGSSSSGETKSPAVAPARPKGPTSPSKATAAREDKRPPPTTQPPAVSRPLPLPSPAPPVGPYGIGAPHGPHMQELDGGAVDEYGVVPPVYNPEWADRRATVAATTPSPVGSPVPSSPPAPAVQSGVSDADEAKVAKDD